MDVIVWPEEPWKDRRTWIMIDRLVKWIGRQALKRTFTSLADETGEVEGSIRNVLLKRERSLNDEERPDLDG